MMNTLWAKSLWMQLYERVSVSSRQWDRRKWLKRSAAVTNFLLFETTKNISFRVSGFVSNNLILPCLCTLNKSDFIKAWNYFHVTTVLWSLFTNIFWSCSEIQAFVATSNDWVEFRKVTSLMIKHTFSTKLLLKLICPKKSEEKEHDWWTWWIGWGWDSVWWFSKTCTLVYNPFD